MVRLRCNCRTDQEALYICCWITDGLLISLLVVDRDPRPAPIATAVPGTRERRQEFLSTKPVCWCRDASRWEVALALVPCRVSIRLLSRLIWALCRRTMLLLTSLQPQHGQDNHFDACLHVQTPAQNRIVAMAAGNKASLAEYLIVLHSYGRTDTANEDHPDSPTPIIVTAAA